MDRHLSARKLLLKGSVMFRRQAIMLACAAMAPSYEVHDDDDAAEETKMKTLAQDLANMEYCAIREAHDDWRTLSYVHDIKLDDEYGALYIVTRDTRLLDRWSMRVDRAMYPGELPVYALGKSGHIEGNDDGYHNVTLLIVGRDGLELERRAFADLYAKYPVVKLFS